MVTVDQFKEYARVDVVEDETIELLLQSASVYFKNRGIDAELLDDEDKKQLQLGILMLMTHYYDNRGVVTDKNLKAIPLGLKAIVMDLQHKCMVHRYKNA